MHLDGRVYSSLTLHFNHDEFTLETGVSSQTEIVMAE